jgi:hypothetical protein
MKTQALNIALIKPVVITVKADVAVKVLLFATILTCINLVAFM